MLAFDAEKVRKNVERATTEDLLDRATAYREGMEPEALEIIEAELRRRGVTAADQNEHARRHPEGPVEAGLPARCSSCPRPAASRGWGWHRLFGVLPLFPRPFWYCTEHQPGAKGRPARGWQPRPGDGPAGYP
ncbi:MAG TPA: hypothetical protein VFA26_03915 [Gemmataceae bacterium]|nr:hypothetical protein [Gemmataceae bacterium]